MVKVQLVIPAIAAYSAPTSPDNRKMRFDKSRHIGTINTLSSFYCSNPRRRFVMEKDRMKSILAGMGIASLVAGMSVVPFNAQGSSG